MDNFKITKVQLHTVVIDEYGPPKRVTTDRMSLIEKSTKYEKQATNTKKGSLALQAPKTGHTTKSAKKCDNDNEM